MAYIYELPDWPKFIWDHQAIAQPLAALRHRQGRLFGSMASLGFQPRSEAMLQTLTLDVLKSSEIEGEILGQPEVRSSIARRLGIDIGALAPLDRAVEGVVELMLDATQNYLVPLTAERLFAWHAALFPTGRSGLVKIRVGAWRDDSSGPMQVVSGPHAPQKLHVVAPPAHRLTDDMAAFLDWFNTEAGLDPILKAALAHLWFVIIHPFDDGNGRIARAIADLVLARSEGSPQRFYSMSAQIRVQRQDYYAILKASQSDSLDSTDWLLWFLACIDAAIASAEIILAKILHKVRFWEALAASPPNPRQRQMLNRLLDGFDGNLTASKWAKLTKISPDTALRDINDLLAQGILQRQPAGGRSTHYVLAAMSVKEEWLPEQGSNLRQFD